jgi:hypothetical protein
MKEGSNKMEWNKHGTISLEVKTFMTIECHRQQ